MGKDNDDGMIAVDCFGVNAFMKGINDGRIVHFVIIDCSNVTTAMADVDFIFIFFGLPFSQRLSNSNALFQLAEEFLRP